VDDATLKADGTPNAAMPGLPEVQRLEERFSGA
jgi:hypothetical protein